MRHLSKQAARVMDALTHGLDEPGAARTIDKAPGAYMAVHVERVAEKEVGPIFSVAHYFKQNGDMMRDPDMEFLRGADGEYYPLSFWQDGGLTVRDEVAEWSLDGREIVRYRPRMQGRLAVFAGKWMANIKQQQGIETRAKVRA